MPCPVCGESHTLDEACGGYPPPGKKRPGNWSLWLVIGMFLLVLAFLAVVVRPAHGDDFSDKIAQLQKKTAARRVDPFAGKNAEHHDAVQYNYSWAPLIDNPDLTYLWDGETCIGYYCYSEGGYHKRTYNGYEQATSQPPVPVPQRSAAEVTSQPIPYYQPTPQYSLPVRSFSGFRSFRSSGGGCSTGSCR